VAEPQKINPVWTGEPCLVVASGPSLTAEVVHKVRMTRWLKQWRAIVVNDVYKLLPRADVLYAADNGWWNLHGKCEGFHGEKWSTHETDPNPGIIHGNDKRKIAEEYGINLVRGLDGDEFSFDPSVIRYGSNSGFQAVNLALLFGATRIVLVGFDMRHVGGKAHFFGDHPAPLGRLKTGEYERFCVRFERAAKKLPKHISIVNATPNSALKCFPMMSLEDAVREDVPRQDDRLHCDGSELQSVSG
jgi:hypothetical protein